MLAQVELPDGEQLEGIAKIFQVFGQGGATLIAVLIIIAACFFLWRRSKKKEKAENSLLAEKDRTIDRLAKESSQKSDIILVLAGGKTHAQILQDTIPELTTPPKRVTSSGNGKKKMQPVKSASKLLPQPKPSAKPSKSRATPTRK